MSEPKDGTPDQDKSQTHGTSPAGGAAGVPESAPGGSTSVDSPASIVTGTTDDAEQQSGGVAVPSATPSLATGVARTGMFGIHGTGDTSGYGGLQRPAYVPQPSDRPYGGYFDEVADALFAAMAERGIPASAVEQITVANTEITFYLQRDQLLALFWAVRDDPALRFEVLSSLSGVDYGNAEGTPVPRQLHVCYEMLSMTYRRRIRLEVAVDVADPYVPSAVPVFPTANWHERETYDMFGIIFSGHPALTRILMPDDWDGHPQRKEYPLGGIPVEYKGAEIPPPDQRRVYS